MVSRERLVRYPALLAVSILENPNQNNIDCHSSDLCKSLPLHNGSAGNGLPLSCVVNGIFIFSLYYKKPLKQRETTKGKCII